MFGLKLVILQLLTTIAITIINTILLISYFELVIIYNIDNFKDFYFPPYTVFYTMFIFFVFFNNLSIPYSNYQSDDLDKEIMDELYNITYHLLISSAITSLTVLTMYGFTKL